MNNLQLLWWRDPIGDIPSIGVVSVTNMTFDDVNTVIDSNLVEEIVKLKKTLLDIKTITSEQSWNDDQGNALNLINLLVMKTLKGKDENKFQ